MQNDELQKPILWNAVYMTEKNHEPTKHLQDSITILKKDSFTLLHESIHGNWKITKKIDYLVNYYSRWKKKIYLGEKVFNFFLFISVHIAHYLFV